jgi:hypothetical protein
MLTAAQIKQYRDDGFVLVENFFKPEELQPVTHWIDELVDSLAKRLLAADKISDPCAGLPFESRLTALEKQFPGAAVLIHIGGILGQPLADLWGNAKLLDLVEQIIGPEIVGHPVWNLRSKTPNNPLVTVPWHQDTAYLAAGSQNTLQPTAWVPLVDVEAHMGTLQVLRGGHRIGRVLPHHLESSRGHRASWYLYIEDRDIQSLGLEVVTCEMKKGSFLLFNQMIPHRSTENHSNTIRWSVDLRWQRPGEPSGFESIKACIPMRRARQRDYKIDWSKWATQNRIADAMKDAKLDDEFSTTVMGPWLERWMQTEQA